MKKQFFSTFFLCLLAIFVTVSVAEARPFTHTTYYVDAGRPDNSGDGLSWATAKKDIQAAINLATATDQVWVKAGTYYPTDIPAGLTATGANTPVSNRDKTILLKDGVNIYGGFAGTESAITERVLGSNRTILDGDIGTPVDSTDNCYHLMVYLGSYTTTGVTIDGFTIRNGTGATYGPGVPTYDEATLTVGGIPYGITRVYGGGIYLQQGINNVINNVVFDKNYAKNRGFGLWTNGGFGLTCSYTVTNCYFINNYGIQSSYGSWATNHGKNYGYNLVFYNNKMLNFGLGDGVAIFLFSGENKFVNCSFVNNNTISGAVVNIANSAKSYFTNCLFYNNKQSTIYNPTRPGAPDFHDVQFLGSFGKFTNCSLSDSASYYTTNYHTLAPGSTGNLFLQNPAFADIHSLSGPDGKYYTSDDGLALPATSPLKNAGINDSLPLALTKDITGANRVLATTVDIGAYETDAVNTCNTPAPAAFNQSFCNSATVASLVATGSNIHWYATATGGLPLADTTSLTDGTKYYASQTVGSCESLVRAVDSVTINTTPGPTAANQTFVCINATVANLVAAGSNIHWYATVTGGSPLAATVPLADGAIYYASQTVGGCESLARAADSVTINNTPAPTTTHNLVVFTGTKTISQLDVTPLAGGTLNYYYEPTGGTALAGSTVVVNDTSFYVTQTVNGCESNPRKNIRVHRIANDTIAFCNPATVANLTATPATGTIVRWYNVPSGGTFLPDLTPITASLDTLYVEQRVGLRGRAISLNTNSNRVPVIVMVNPAPNVTANSDKVVCNNSAVAVNFSTATTGSTVTYGWTNNKTSIGLAANGTGDIASFTAVNNSTAPDTATIIVTPTINMAGVSCTGAKDTFLIIVNPAPVLQAIPNNILCNGAAVPELTPATTATGGSIQYVWANDNTAIGLPGGGTGNIPAFTATNTGTTPITANITIIPVFTNNGLSCTGSAQTYMVTVNPTATVHAVSNQVLCNGSATTAVNFYTTSTDGAVTYTWTNNNTTIGLAASGSGNIASFTATNSSNAPVTATITVTPTFTNAGISCVGTANTFTITVNPTTEVNAVSNKVVCNGSAVAAINFGNNVNGGTVTYAWTNNTPGIGLASSGTGNIASFTATNSSNVPVTATIAVTPMFNNGGVSCTGAAQSFTITVNPTAVVNTVSNQTVCAGLTNSGVSFSSPVAGAIYTWVNSNPSIGLAAGGSGNVPSFTAVNPLPNATNATITVTPNTAAGCTGQAITYTITVNGLSTAPVSIGNPTPIVCANDAFATLGVNGGVLGSGAVWKWYADSLNTVSIGTGTTLLNIPVARTTNYFVRAEGACNTTAAASITVQRANLVNHVRQHWSDVLLFDNSSRNYVAWQWYKNGVAVSGATLQQYSESNALAGTYHVVAIDRNGQQTISCPLTITAGSFTGLRIGLFPNPVDMGANITVSTNFTASALQGANITISDLYGVVIGQVTPVSPNTTLRALAATGMYIVTLTLQNGMKYSANLLTR